MDSLDGALEARSPPSGDGPRPAGAAGLDQGSRKSAEGTARAFP